MPIDKGFSPLFSYENAPKNHCFTKHIEKFICRREISTGFSGNFSGQVGARIDDIEHWKVKRYLFSKGAFLSFRVNYLGRFLIANCAGKKCTARCSQRVAQRFSDVCTLWSSYQWANISAEPHVASNVRYIAFSMRTNTLLTPSKARYISYLGHTPNTAEPHAFKQGVVHCLVTTSDVPRNVKSKLFSRENF